MDSFLIELGKSGPWALVAGFLLLQVIKDKKQDRDEWKAERESWARFMKEFQTTQNAIVGEVQDIARSLHALVTKLDDTRTASSGRG